MQRRGLNCASIDGSRAQSFHGLVEAKFAIFYVFLEFAGFRASKALISFLGFIVCRPTTLRTHISNS